MNYNQLRDYLKPCNWSIITNTAVDTPTEDPNTHVITHNWAYDFVARNNITGDTFTDTTENAMTNFNNLFKHTIPTNDQIFIDYNADGTIAKLVDCAGNTLVTIV